MADEPLHGVRASEGSLSIQTSSATPAAIRSSEPTASAKAPRGVRTPACSRFHRFLAPPVPAESVLAFMELTGTSFGLAQGVVSLKGVSNAVSYRGTPRC